MSKFKFKDKVKLSVYGLSNLKAIPHVKQNDRGIVVGFGKLKDSVLIMRLGRKLPDMFYDIYWELDK